MSDLEQRAHDLAILFLRENNKFTSPEGVAAAYKRAYESIYLALK